MKIILAPDKFKGSLSGTAFCDAVEKGIKNTLPQADIIKMPLADGGDGTMEVLAYHLHGKRISIEVTDPLFRKINASYLFIEDTQTAIIEMAEASGMKLLSPEEQHCFFTTSFGTGEIIKNAIKKGAKTIVLGIGGSATNDCGIGMATALGYRFLDKHDIQVNPIGKNLSSIIKIDGSKKLPGLENIIFKVACDVTNPLHGRNGSAMIYAPQKGASEKEVILLDKGLKHMAQLFLEVFNTDVQKISGSGAAGGMGAGAMVFLNAELLSGIDLVKELTRFDSIIENANWIISGEGKLDSQTFSGKTIQGVLLSAKKQNIPVALFCGESNLDQTTKNSRGIVYLDTVLEKASNKNDALTNCREYLYNMAKKFAKQIELP